jgi:hypothetical protein
MCAFLRNAPHFEALMMGEISKISVLLKSDEAERFDAYCKQNGFKKSSLIARLIREHLTRERFQSQNSLSENIPPNNPQKQR